jgi:hypothetical protein
MAFDERGGGGVLEVKGFLEGGFGWIWKIGTVKGEVIGVGVETIYTTLKVQNSREVISDGSSH